MHPAEGLLYRLTARQKRTQRIVAAVFALVTLVLAALAASGVKAGRSGFLFLLAAPLTLVFVYMALNNTRLFTECTPAGLRARTRSGRVRKCPWPQVVDIRVKVVSGRGSYRKVVVSTTGRRRIHLGLPMDSIMTAEEFDACVQQIRDYWHAASAS